VTIQLLAAGVEAPMVVLGAPGGFQERPLGAVAQRVLYHADVPVPVVRRDG